MNNAMVQDMRTSGQDGILDFGSRTDIGLVREHNEDSLVANPPLFAVCDGMGGHEAGEVASEIAIATIANNAPRVPDADALGRSVEDANLAIIRAVNEGIGREGMGTTCTAAVLEGERLVIAQAGDSRAYLLHNGMLQQLTHDHSLVADMVEAGEILPSEARTHPWRSYITRALGLDPKMEADIYELNVATGDRLMLCSDGLYSMVDDSNIARILGDEPSAQNACDALVEAALEAGGQDNVSVIVVDAQGSAAKVRRKMERKSKVLAISIIIALVAIIAAGIFAVNWWVQNSAYLGEVDGKVAVYKGIPGEVLGMGFSELDEITDVNLSDLQPGIANRIQSNAITCDSLEDAHNLIEEYKTQINNQQDQPLDQSADQPSTNSSNDTNTVQDADQSSDQATSQSAGHSSNQPEGQR